MLRLLPVVFGILLLGPVSPLAAADLSVKQLNHSRYFIPGWEDPEQGEWVQVKNGEFDRRDPENILYVKVMKIAFGHLTSQKAKDAAVVYGFGTGGTGFFMHLVAVINDQGSPKNLEPLGLGDRVKINALSIKNGKIILDMLVHGPYDPAPRPTVKKIATYRLAGNKLIEQ